jgi:hypothetical protein
MLWYLGLGQVAWYGRGKKGKGDKIDGDLGAKAEGQLANVFVDTREYAQRGEICRK